MIKKLQSTVHSVQHSTINRGILVFVFIYGLLTIDYGLVFGQADSIRVKGNTEAGYLTFSGNRTSYPENPSEGEIFYNSAEKAVKYFDGIQWRPLSAGVGSKSIATKVVAAANTPGAASRADYVCTGTNDETTINSAINDLGAQGGTVYLTEGTYNISTSIVISASNVSLIGSGTATLLQSVSLGSMVVAATSVSAIRIARLRILYNGTASVCAIYFNTVNESSIEDVSVENCQTGIYFANTCSYNRILGCYFKYKPSQVGACAVNFLSSLTYGYNIIHGNIMGGRLSGGVGLLLGSKYNIVSENYLFANAYGINCANTEHNILLNNDIRDMDTGIGSTNSFYNIISQNSIQNSTTIGLRANNGQYHVISGNSFYANGRGLQFSGTSKSNVISSNLISEDKLATAEAYSMLYDNSGENLVLANRIYSGQNATGEQYGIQIKNTSTQNYLSGNFIDGSRYEVKIKDDGSGTQYTDKAKLSMQETMINVSAGTYSLDFKKIGSYIKLNSTYGISGSNVNLTLGNGHGTGSIIVLQNISADNRTFTVGEGLGPVNVYGSTVTLGPGDTLSLIYNGSKWLGLTGSNNG